MTDRPAASRPCAVVGCTGTCTDPGHVLNTSPPETLPHPVPLCPEHWRRVDGGAPWVAEEQQGESGRRAVRVVLGDELVGRGLVVAGDDDVVWRRGGYSPQLEVGRNFGVLHVQGRVHGSGERRQLDLALTPEAVKQLRHVLRLYPEA